VGDHQEAEEDSVADLQVAQEGHREEEVVDHREEEVVDHREVVLALAKDTPEETNWWETRPRSSMENARGHSCSSPNGRSTGVSTIRLT